MEEDEYEEKVKDTEKKKHKEKKNKMDVLKEFRKRKDKKEKNKNKDKDTDTGTETIDGELIPLVRQEKRCRPLAVDKMDHSIEITVLHDYLYEELGEDAVLAGIAAGYLTRPKQDGIFLPRTQMPQSHSSDLDSYGNLRAQLVTAYDKVMVMTTARPEIPETEQLLVRDIHFGAAARECDRSVPVIHGSGQDTMSDKFFMLTDYKPFDTVESLNAADRMPIDSVECLTRDTLVGCFQFSEAGLTHGNISPSTLVMDEDGRFFICNWGYGKHKKGSLQFELRDVALTVLFLLRLGPVYDQIKLWFETGADPGEIKFDAKYLWDLSILEPRKERFLRFVTRLPRGGEEALMAAQHYLLHFRKETEDAHKPYVAQVAERIQRKNFIVLGAKIPYLARNPSRIFRIANALGISFTRCSQAIYTKTFDQIEGYENLSVDDKKFITKLQQRVILEETPASANFVENEPHTSLIGMCEYARNFRYVGVLTKLQEVCRQDDETFNLKIVPNSRYLKSLATVANIDHAVFEQAGFKELQRLASKMRKRLDKQARNKREEDQSKLDAVEYLRDASDDVAAAKEVPIAAPTDKQKKNHEPTPSNDNSSSESESETRKAKRSRTRSGERTSEDSSSESSGLSSKSSSEVL